MIAKVFTTAIVGVTAVSVEVEVRTSGGPPHFTLIGLGDSSVREARDRVLAAIRSSGFSVPNQILVNLAPADVRKIGTGFDLPIALGILASSQQIPWISLAGRRFIGELSLDGSLKAVKGVIVSALHSREVGDNALVVPGDNGTEAALIEGLNILPCDNLQELAAFLKGELLLSPQLPANSDPLLEVGDFADVTGQEIAKRALSIAAAGRHNLLMIGPPGCGKSMLAQRFVSILPPLNHDDVVETAKIHSVAGLNVAPLLSGRPPVRSPHHGASMPGLVGGGSPPRPGEISLAHNGVLFLDELPEFPRPLLESLRAPLEDGSVNIIRAHESLSLPARFQFLAAMNPCPCGRLGSQGAKCGCSAPQIIKYVQKISQPILDRIDLHVELEAVSIDSLVTSQLQTRSDNPKPAGPNSQVIRKQVLMSRDKQLNRQKKLNSQLNGQELSEFVRLTESGRALLTKGAKALGFSARSCVRVLRVARTIADMESKDDVTPEHVAEAISFRRIERVVGGSASTR